MKRYSRRWFIGLQSQSQQTEPTADQVSTESYRPHPPQIRATLPQQQPVHATLTNDSTPSDKITTAPSTNTQTSVVAPLPTATYAGVREIVFSFDDGPSTVATAKILDVLARYQIRTIFFVLGQKIASRAGRELMIRAHGEGHLIANHTYSHPNLAQLDADSIHVELQRTEELIGDYAAPGRLMRPPYGALSDTVHQVLDESGYTAVLWTTASLDWQFQNSEWVGYTLDKIQNGPQHNHILMHDTYRWTADNLESFIQSIQALPNTRIASFSS